MKVYAAIDVDGVVLDLVGYITERLGIDAAKWTTWEFKHSYDDTEHRMEFDRLIKSAPDMFVHAKPYSDARAAIQKLLDEEIDFCFMSDFPSVFRGLREWWLWYNLIQPEYATHKPSLLRVESAEKAAVCKMHGVTHILEDKRATAIDCITHGIRAYLVPRVYNRPTFDSPYVPDATIDQFVDLIIMEARRS